MSLFQKLSVETFVIAILLSTLDIVALSPALSSIMVEYHHHSIHWSVWIISLHLAFFSFSLPIMESWAANTGRYKVFHVSLFLFAFGSLVIAFSNMWVWMMWGRVIQAVGAGGIVPYVAVQARRMISKGSRYQKLFVILMLAGCLVFTPLFTAALVYLFSWRSVFYLYFLLSIFLFVLSRRWMVVERPGRSRPIHGEGIFFFGAMILFLMTAVTSTDLLHGWRAWTQPHVIPLWIIALGLVVPLFMIERQSRQPFFEPHLFAHWRLWLLYFQVALTGFIWMALVLVPAWMIHLYPLHHILSGAVLSYILLCSVVSLPLVLRLTAKWSFKGISVLGFMCAAISYAVLAWVPAGWFHLLTLAILGAGLTLTQAAPAHRLLFRWVPPRQIKSALMAIGMFRAAGGALGLVAMARFFSSFHPLTNNWFIVGGIQEALVIMAQHHVMVLAAWASGVGLVLSLFLPIHNRR
ncbi:MFS transporter [Paenactinomyces guangxiensis]|uniref:MFS transporter n=1 Tax=Paenactinomyces guangxiensis TaxID=1490290 RepID=A0A7W1WQK3_9BACL|nr:MFS transporter [Paenactinomyces guangxiensis]MBA4494259.1 MFS transporter [Paenactinomyces guangxiensis]MBH8590755.1 MFS transporter [Paenactinomyces guangxiensis]